jgi:hypothetical protein
LWWEEPIENLAKISIGNQVFINPPEGHQGFWILNRQQMKRHMSSGSFAEISSRRIVAMGIRERAVSAFFYENIPYGFEHRNVIPLLNNKLSFISAIHHMPNKYVNKPDNPWGKMLFTEAIRL